MVNPTPPIKMVIPNDAAGLVPPGPGFTVVHQKVELEVDLAKKSLKGKTEITIQPTHAKLQKVRLHCRQSVLSKLHVNGQPPLVKYSDPFAKTSINKNTTVHQWHLLSQKLAEAFKDPTEDLIVSLPKVVPINETSPLTPGESKTGPKIILGRKRSLEDAGLETPASTTAPKSAEEPAAGKFNPMVISLDFATESFRDGLQFVGCEEGDARYPHVYTRNSPVSGSISSVFPCVDDVSSRCTWEIAIKCPRTLGDAFGQKHGAEGGHDNAGDTMDIDQPDQRFTKEDAARQLTVVCSGELTDEVRRMHAVHECAQLLTYSQVVDTKDPTKKICSFFCATAISAQHVGFSVGPYDYVDLAAFREVDEDERLGQNAVPVHGYCLPGRREDLMATCIPMAKVRYDYYWQK